MTKLRFHRVAELFPMMDEAELSRLAEDIRANGQREAIWLHSDGSILDGRNRYRACEIVGAEPKTRTWNGKDGSEVAFVISLNLHRRHLNESQRAMVAARVATLEHGQRKTGQLADVPTQESAAAMLNVGERTVRRAREVLESATPEVVAAVDSGIMPVSFAATLATAPEKTQRVIAAKVEAGCKPTQAAREHKREALGDKVAALPNGKHRVIYADPPWQYSDSRGGLEDYADSAAAGQYPTMSTDDLCAMAVADLAAPDCVLFCWATFPLLEDALRVVKEWGFKYKTAFVWSKVRPNMGNYHTADAELLLVATRGSCTPEAEKHPAQVQTVERTGRHSEKPEHFRELIDSLYLNGPRIELFRRGAAPKGWKVWGNESA
jgi:N6-adenosine-specific RNA methylase IME4/ParB-like chromosome segregation protein Spo0J